MLNKENIDKKEKENQRKREWRARQKAIADESYVPTPIEEAKKYLESIDDPQVAAVYDHPEFGQKLTQEDKRVITNYVYHLKIKRKSQQSSEVQRAEEEHIIAEKAQELLLQKTFDLRQSLLMPLNHEERVSLIKDAIDQNLFLFLEYMESSQMPFDTFLRIIIGLQDSIDPQSFKDLFVRVCTFSKIDDLEVTVAMIQDAMDFLVDKKHDEKAAFGLLRLIFQNNITLSSFPRVLLIKFQDEYLATIPRFFKSLGGLQTQVSESLPPSVFCFTTPIISSLRDGGQVFFTQVPYQFLPYVVQIVSYSFTESQESFDHFFLSLKTGFKEYYNELLQNKFADFLQRILEETKGMSQKYFESLDHTRSILEKSFSLLKQRQIAGFTPIIIKSLLEANDDILKQMQQKPRIVPKNSRMKLEYIIQGMQFLNKGQDFSIYNLNTEIQDSDKAPFLALGIEDPLPLQVVCFNLCTSEDFEGRHVIQLETGCGKTALCFTIACHFAKKGMKALIINESEELTFRDYKKALETSNNLNLLMNIVQREQQTKNINDGLTFISFMEFSKNFKDLGSQVFDNSVIICDEFDSIVFGSDENYSLAVDTLHQLKKFIGFTGSELKDIHVKAVEAAIAGDLIRMNVHNVYKPPPSCKGVDVYSKVSDYRETIAQFASQQACQTPVIIIAEDDRSFLAHKIQREGVMVEQLWKKSISDSNGALTIFTRKQGDKYPVFIISDAQGRGLDFPTSTEIEEKGGIFLIVAKLPSGYLQYKQFLGRTGRIGNKSQYAVVLHDQEARSEQGDTYLEKNLVAMLNKDLQLISARLSNKPKEVILADGKNNDEEEKESRVKADQSIIDLFSSSTSEQKASVSIIEVSATQTIRSSQDVIVDNQNEQIQYSMPSENNSQKNQTMKKREAKQVRKQNTKLDILTKEQERRRNLRDQIYFEEYSKNEIHKILCSDNIRVSAYKDALALLANGNCVLDIGSGTGVLSFAAVEAGASRVYAVEQAEIYRSCNKEIKKRGLKSKVKVMNCKAEEAPLEGMKLEILVSEWMGYFLLFERMLPSVLCARDKFLDQAGILIPGSARIYIAAIEGNNVYPIKAIQSSESRQSVEAIIEAVTQDTIVSSSSLVLDLNLMKAPADFDSFSSDFTIDIQKDCSINALVGWFDVQMSPDVWLSTSPFAPQTHWHQTVFPLLEKKSYKAGSTLIGKLDCRPPVDDHRALEIILELQSCCPDDIATMLYHIR